MPNAALAVVEKRLRVSWTERTKGAQFRRYCFALFCGHFLLSPPPSIAASVCTVASDNMVQNCGFETGDLTGWVVTPAVSGSDYYVNSYDVNSGLYSLAFGAVAGLNDYIDQSLTTIPGQPYNISFYVDSSQDVAPGQFVAIWDGANILTITDGSGSGYELYSFMEVANTNNTDLQFGGNSPPSWYYLDEVIVTPTITSGVPEPAAAWLVLLGLAGILLVSRISHKWKSQ